MGVASTVSGRSLVAKSRPVRNTGYNQRQKVLRAARSSSVHTVPWKRAIVRTMGNRAPKWAELYRSMGWTAGMMWWKCKQPDLRATVISQLADALGIKRGRLFEAIVAELEEDGVIARPPRADR